MRRSVWMRVLAAVLIISMLAAPVSAAARRPSPSYGTNCIVGGIISIIRDIIRDIWDDWFDVPGDEDPEPTPPEQPTDPSEPTEPGETEPEDPTEPEETLKTVLNLIEGHANTANGHLLRGVTYSLSQLAEEQSEPTPGSLRDIKAIAIGAARAAAPSAQLNAAASSVQPMADTETTSESVKITGITGTASSVDTSEAAFDKSVSNAFDGNYNTFWATKESGTLEEAYLIADLHGEYTIDKVVYTKRIYNGSYDCTGNLLDYIIEVSTDGTSWTQVATGNTNTTGGTEITFNAVPATHVRLRATQSYHWQAVNANKVMTCAEFEVYGYAESTEEPDPEQPVAPEEPEQPESAAELVYFPVTMFNYDGATINGFTDRMDANGTTVREGFYFSDGGSELGSVTYNLSSDLSVYVDGNYYIQNLRAKDNGVGSWLYYNPSASNGRYINSTTQEDAQIWTLTNKGNNQITLSYVENDTTYYMTIGDTTSSVTTEETILTLEGYTHSEKGVQIKGTEYLCQFGGVRNTVYGGYEKSNDQGNGMAFFPVAADGTVSSDPIICETITNGLASGYEKWNWWSYLSDGNNAQNKFYTGLVEDQLDENNEIVFTVNEPGIFTFDSADPTNTNDGKKDIYQNVGLPFVKNEKGYYTFDSDAHGTYFADTTGDGNSDPWYGASDNYFNMFFDYQNTQGWADKSNPNSNLGYGDLSKNLWAPYNTNANDTGAGAIDYHFGMRADIPFSMTPNGCIKSTDDNSEHITFTFAGDDDVWIFIDGHLVIDLGGIHNRIGATIDFAANTITYFRPESNGKTLPIGSFNDPDNYPLNADGTITVKLYNDTDGEGALGQTRTDFASDEEHEMSIFYLERGKGTSNCKIEFNLPMRDTVLITKDATKSWSEAKDNEDGEDGDGTDYLTAKEQAAVDKLNFGFTLYKKTADETAFTAVTNTNFFVQDKTGKVIATSSTDGNGKFYLKNGQTAKFMTDIPKEGITYYVVEDTVPAGFLTPDYKYAGAATWGYDYIGEAILKDENGDYILDAEGNLTSGTVRGTVTNAAAMGEHELPMDATENKSYEVTVKGSVESIDSIEFICTNYLDAELPNPSALANEDIIVIDYGLPVQIDPLANDLFRGDNIEIVAWGDESLTLNEVKDESGNNIPHDTEGGTNWSGNKVLAAAKVAANNNSYNNALIDLADCLYTFKAVGDGCYEVSATTADGTKVYLNHYTSDTNEIPHDSIPGRIKIENGANQNMFKLIAQVMEGGTGNARTLHFHTEQTVPYWNRCGNDTSFKCQEYLYRPAGKDDVSSTEIPGYVMVTSLDQIVDGGQYLIVHDKDYNSTDDDLFVLHPSTSGDKYDHVAKLETTDVPAIGTSFSFDSGNVTFKDETYAETVNADGTVTFTRDSFEYELTKQMTEVEEIRYIIKVTSSEVQDGTQITNTACRYALGKIYIVPATIMYYEENFSDMVTFTGSGWRSNATVEDQDNVSAYQEPGVVGTVGDSTYGSDVAYLSDDGDSNGTYRFGDTTDGAIRFTYTFTGTGSSIFARTSANTGYMQVKLYRGTETTNEALEDITYRDTYWKDKNGTQLDAAGTLYNIPVYSTDENLPYDTYTVVCTIAKKGTVTAGNDTGAGNEFYLDGIRILRPLDIVIEQDGEWDEEGNLIQPIVYDELTTKALGAYADDGETNLDVVTLRQKLITDYDYLLPEEDENGEVVGEKEKNWPFAVLTDIEGKIVLASDYISIGPKNEVYLSEETSATNGQSVTFSLKYWQPEGLKLYMGMKAPFGHASVNVGHENIELNNAPDCYYDVTKNYASLEEKTDADGNTYYVVTYTFEAAESIVSLTNIKVVGNYEFLILEQFDEEVDGSTGDGNG